MTLFHFQKPGQIQILICTIFQAMIRILFTVIVVQSGDAILEA